MSMAVFHRYFTVKSDLEMDLGSVIAMDFMNLSFISPAWAGVRTP